MFKIMARKPYKPAHLVRTRMIPIRVSEEESQWLSATSERLGIPVSNLMREGARFYAMQLEQKGEPRKEKSHRGSQQKVVSTRKRQRSHNEERNRLQASISKEKA